MPQLAIRSADGSRRQVALAKDRVSIGRSRECDVFLPDQWLSRQHAEIRRRGDGFFLADLGSKNGTLLNGSRIEAERALGEGDEITLGEHVLTFLTGEGLGEPEDDAAPAGTRIFSARELSRVVSSEPSGADELSRQTRLLNILTRAIPDLLAHRALPELFEVVLNLLFEAVAAERGAIVLLEGEPPRPAIKASRSRAGQPITRVSRSISRRVLEGLEALLIPNVLEDASLSAQESILSTGIRSAMCAPLWFRAPDAALDSVIGLVYLDTRERVRSFSEEDLSILTSLANLAAAKIENVRLLEESLEKRRMEQDMQVAAEIQQSLLPRAAPSVAGYELVGSNEPCRTVGGDYYDYALDDDRLLLALGDVSGKGTGAALLMTVLRASVRAHWAEGTPAEAVARINRTVCENVPSNKYITFFLARLDARSGRLVYVNAGHNPPLLVRANGRVEKLSEGGMVLGLFDSASYVEGDVELGAGDLLLIFSDGLTEAWSPAGEEFGEEGVEAVVVDKRKLPAQKLQHELLRAAHDFAGGAKASDDRTLILLKRRPA